MNSNIEVITPELWAVNSEYIKAGWIRELSPVSDLESINEYVSLTNDGIMILKKESELYPTLKLFVPKIMRRTDEELQLCTIIKDKTVLNNYEKFYLNVIEWEIERRRVRADYMNHPTRRRLKDRIRVFFKR